MAATFRGYAVFASLRSDVCLDLARAAPKLSAGPFIFSANTPRPRTGQPSLRGQEITHRGVVETAPLASGFGGQPLVPVDGSRVIDPVVRR